MSRAIHRKLNLAAIISARLQNSYECSSPPLLGCTHRLEQLTGKASRLNLNIHSPPSKDCADSKGLRGQIIRRMKLYPPGPIGVSAALAAKLQPGLGTYPRC
jgi:hypothetical protein